MTGAADALAALAAGERPAGEALLHSCRLEGWGTQLYGEEAVLDAFQSAPAAPTDWDRIEDEAGVALFGDEIALFADTVEGRLQRAWRLGPGPCLPEERGIFVPFDPDLAQARGDVLRSEGEPDLEAAIRAGGLAILADVRAVRKRAFPLRIVRHGADVAVLFAIYRLGDGPACVPGFSYAAARLRVAGHTPIDCRIVRDLAGEGALAARPLLPRI